MAKNSNSLSRRVTFTVWSKLWSILFWYKDRRDIDCGQGVQ